MLLIAITLASFLLAVVPALLFLKNLRVYLPPPPPGRGEAPQVSLLIPARNEERSIAAAIGSGLDSTGVDLEILVLDDDSSDRTADIVAGFAARDGRVRLLAAAPLPPGWCGKQYACARLASGARYPLLAFIDADVRLAPDGLARMIAFLDATGAELVSGIPRQETGSWLEQAVLPLIHFVLLGFLPLDRMRRSPLPAYGAGCGQLFVTTRAAYDQAGGHGAIRSSLHDGLQLPRAYRRAGLATDVCDATLIARCRMYRSAGELWKGLAKNATEGLGSPALLVPATLILLGGQVLPMVLLCAGWASGWVALLATAGVLAGYWPRIAGIRRFRQPLLGAVLHPVGVVVLVAIQWWAAGRAALGLAPGWKGRLIHAADEPPESRASGLISSLPSPSQR